RAARHLGEALLDVAPAQRFGVPEGNARGKERVGSDCAARDGRRLHGGKRGLPPLFGDDDRRLFLRGRQLVFVDVLLGARAASAFAASAFAASALAASAFAVSALAASACAASALAASALATSAFAASTRAASAFAAASIFAVAALAASSFGALSDAGIPASLSCSSATRVSSCFTLLRSASTAATWSSASSRRRRSRSCERLRSSIPLLGERSTSEPESLRTNAGPGRIVDFGAAGSIAGPGSRRGAARGAAC